MSILLEYDSHFTKYLTPTQIEALRILLWLLMVHKQVRIERLAACFPLPVLYESRRKHIQRFLILPALSVSLLWFPLIKSLINKEFKTGSRLIITIDRTQWKDKNVFVIAVIWKKRALPIYWQLLNKRGASNLAEQQALIRPVLRLLKHYELVIIGDKQVSQRQVSLLAQRKCQETKSFLRLSSKTRHQSEKQT